MLNAICTECKNFFEVPNGRHFGQFTVRDGAFYPPLDFLQEGQYFRIVGSVFNDGVYKYADSTQTLKNETFDGAVWAMAVPAEVIDLAERVGAWQEKNAELVSSPYQSEAFGGYSYTLKSSGGAAVSSWRDVFRSELNRYRKIRL